MFPIRGRELTLSFAQSTRHWVFAYLFVVVVLNLIIMDLDDGLLSSCGNKEVVMAAAITTTSLILEGGGGGKVFKEGTKAQAWRQ